MLKPYNLEPHPRTLMLSRPSPMQLLTKTAIVSHKNHLMATKLILQSLRPIPPLMLPPMQLLTKPLQILTLMLRLQQRVLEPQLPWHKTTPRLKKKKRRRKLQPTTNRRKRRRLSKMKRNSRTRKSKRKNMKVKKNKLKKTKRNPRKRKRRLRLRTKLPLNPINQLESTSPTLMIAKTHWNKSRNGLLALKMILQISTSITHGKPPEIHLWPKSDQTNYLRI